MELNEKLQNLRKQKGLTQEQLAEALHVSRTAISKWESGRGYPNIESLKDIAKFFSVSLDELLSSDALLTIAQRKESHTLDLIFGLLDCSVAMLLFLPFFGQTINGAIQASPLWALTAVSGYLKIAYCVFVITIALWGLLTLALQNWEQPFWTQSKRALSLLLNIGGALLFIISSQPYAAIFLFLFLIIKTLMLLKRR